MAIVLKYGSPGSILQAQYAAGVGSRKNKEQDDLLKLWQQQQTQAFQGQQAAIDRQQRAGLQQVALNFQADQDAAHQYAQDKNRFFQAEQSKLDRDFRAGQTDKALSDRYFQQDATRQQQLQLQKNRDDALRIRNTEEGLQKGDLELPEPARRKLNQLEEGLVAAMELDPSQQQEFREKYDKQKRDLLSFARPVPKVSPEEQFQQNTFEKDGTLYQRTDKGLDVLKDSQPAQQKQAEKAQAAAADYSKTLHAEMARLQKANQTEDGKLQPLETYAEEAKKGLSAAGITPPAQQATPTDGSYYPGKYEADAKKMIADRGLTPPEQAGVTRGQWGDGQNGEPVTAPPPELVKAMADNGAKDPARAAAVYQSIKSGQGQAEQSSYTPEMRQSILQGSQLPRPQSAEEAAALGKGASWVAPDGTIRRNP